jgi:hypothetical protein
MTKPRLSAAMAILVVPLLLSGCSGDEYGIAALDAPPGPDDVASLGVDLPFPEEIDEATLRLLVEDDGRQYFGAQTADGAQACVAVFSMEQQFGAYVGCGATTSSGNRIVTVSGPDGRSTALVRDNADAERLASDGLRRIHRNVHVSR